MTFCVLSRRDDHYTTEPLENRDVADLVTVTVFKNEECTLNLEMVSLFGAFGTFSGNGFQEYFLLVSPSFFKFKNSGFCVVVYFLIEFQ